MADRLNDATRSAVRIGLIADASCAAEMLAALRRIPEVALVAVGGNRIDADLEPQAARYSDGRTLIVQGGVEAVVLAIGTRSAVELAEIAADADVHVWRPPPLARTFAEAVQLAARRKGRTSLYRVASWWDHAREHVAATIGHFERFSPTMTSVDVRAPSPRPDHWSLDRAESGGGVVLHAAYEMLLAMVALRGLPTSVWACSARAGGPAGEPGRYVEKSCCAICTFPDGTIGTFRTAWDLRPHTCRMELAGVDGRVEVSPSDAHAWGAADVPIAGSGLPADYGFSDLARFFAEVRGGHIHALESLDLHLATVALVEAIYLSSVTGQPEFPRKQYEIQQWPLPSR